MIRLGSRSLPALVRPAPVVLSALLALALPVSGMAGVPKAGTPVMPTQEAAAAEEAAAREPGAQRYRRHTDEDLTALAADWDALDRYQRRALLTEMKLRMARKGGGEGVIHIRTERRYGRIIRQSDGRVIRIETQVVHVRPVDPEDLKARQSFGVGFEQRVGRREELVPGPAGGTEAPTAAPDEPATLSGPTLEDVLDSLAPSPQPPVVNRPPVYQVSEPQH